jgi:riboflavin kinase/FMN adenylyltransferase
VLYLKIIQYTEREGRSQTLKIYDYVYGQKIEGRRVLALGLFDGVHLGHRQLIEEARLLSVKLGASLSVFTFKAENSLLKGGERIYSTEKKLSILESLSVDEVIMTDFSAVSKISAVDFARSVFSDMGAAVAVCGADFKFGKGAVGNTELLSRVACEYDASLLLVDEVTMHGEKISSGKIKALLSEGKIKEANELLGQRLSSKFKVLHGDGRGQSLGYPTVNTECDAFSSLLRRGVYKTEVSIDKKIHTGITNVGVCPTFEKRKTHTETYILDFSGDLYGKEISISFIDFLRPEIEFKTKEELILQIKRDEKSVRK